MLSRKNPCIRNKSHFPSNLWNSIMQYVIGIEVDHYIKWPIHKMQWTSSLTYSTWFSKLPNSNDISENPVVQNFCLSSICPVARENMHSCQSCLLTIGAPPWVALYKTRECSGQFSIKLSFFHCETYFNISQLSIVSQWMTIIMSCNIISTLVDMRHKFQVKAYVF